ncbi:hypothetical protein Droror1_Dr00021104, partial [Drosera rotundifolia]
MVAAVVRRILFSLPWISGTLDGRLRSQVEDIVVDDGSQTKDNGFIYFTQRQRGTKQTLKSQDEQ